MSNVKLIVGLQWGNEGKHRITHYMSNNAICMRSIEVNHRSQSINVKGKNINLYILPRSIIKPNNVCILAAGIAIDLEVLLNEIIQLKELGIKITPENLIISPRANIIMPYHLIASSIYESVKNSKTAESILKGVSHCYSDQLNGIGISMYDLTQLSVAELVNKMDIPVKIYNSLFSEKELHLAKYHIAYSMIIKYQNFFSVFVKDETKFLFNALAKNKRIVLEGNSSSSALFASGAITPNNNDVYGIIKAYTSKSSDEPSFYTEENNNIGEIIRRCGHEYDETTKKPRRCGWLDLVQVKKSIISNGVTSLCLNHLDTICKISKEIGYINVCISYSISDNSTHCIPIYHQFNLNGFEWDDISTCTKYDNLPTKAKEFIEFIEDYTNVPVKIIGTGPHLKNFIIKQF